MERRGESSCYNTFPRRVRVVCKGRHASSSSIHSPPKNETPIKMHGCCILSHPASMLPSP
jgi:hypothetical protein